ncbi:DUF222 domain-containing protein [Cellulomonas sp. NPDC089187]|uniref:HNH endonuclease signature motif containing protein n=1 Tax=Cellulomonas sp. NPDC089187 TaxID=3154970 RepID=UPI003420F441
MALDLHEYDSRVVPARSRARVLSDPWEVGGDLAVLDAHDHPQDAGDWVTDVVPDWVEDPVLAARVAAEQGAADPTMTPEAQVDAVLAAQTGPGLAALLGNLDLGTVALDDLPAVAVGAARLEAWAHAVSARVAAELASRPEMNPIWPAQVGRITQPNIAADELSMRLNIGRRSAQMLVDEGRAYERWLPATGQALADGVIDVPRARTMVRRLAGVDAVTVAQVEAAVLPGAGDRTVQQLGRDIDRALLRVDPDGGELRRRQARVDRHVSRPRALPDGMAGIWAVLPADGAERLNQALDASARELRRRGDGRTLGQLRADALLDAALVGPGWAPLVPGHGGENACHCGHARSGGAAHGVDHGHAGSAASDVGDRHAGCGAHDGDHGHGGGGAHDGESSRRARAEVRVTVPLSALIGVDDAPGELDGYGPIDAATARALAAGGTWRRIVTDPMSGAVLDVGRTRYRPPAELAEHVIARDRTCARPGCTVPAGRCDLDHTVPYSQGGSTSADKLAPLCRRDHLLRTHAGHRIEQVAPGEITWTTPTRRYRSVPGRDGEHHMTTGAAPPRGASTETSTRGSLEGECAAVPF